jgi:hypothetical protein
MLVHQPAYRVRAASGNLPAFQVLTAEAGVKAANASRRALTALRAFSHTLQEPLEATCIPASLILWMAGAMLSLVPLVLFGSLLGTLLAFLMVVGNCAYFALRSPALKQQALRRDQETLA